MTSTTVTTAGAALSSTSTRCVRPVGRRYVSGGYYEHAQPHQLASDVPCHIRESGGSSDSRGLHGRRARGARVPPWFLRKAREEREIEPTVDEAVRSCQGWDVRGESPTLDMATESGYRSSLRAVIPFLGIILKKWVGPIKLTPVMLIHTPFGGVDGVGLTGSYC